MNRLFYIILVFLGCFVFFRVFFPILAVIFIGFMLYSFIKSLLAPREKQEDYYEQNVHNPHQSSESDIIDVEAVVIEEE